MMSTRRVTLPPLVFISFLIFQVQLSTPLSRFLFHQDLQMVGCSTKSYTGIIHLACAMKCLDTKKCPSFVYIPEKAYCKICTDGYTVTGLTFSFELHVLFQSSNASIYFNR
ncbi:hypothetical protein BgiBS90_003999 [Biomphalaria glabrata]|nr:hypothetical protein BgiBS90_003999 [Biomphalaria glabrata]